MSTDPKLPDARDESDSESVTTPGGNVGELHDLIDETSAAVPDDDASDETSPPEARQHEA